MSTASSPPLHSLIWTLPFSVAFFDTKMRYIAYSKVWLNDYKLDPSENLLGRSHYEVFPEISTAWKEVHQYCLQGKTKRSGLDRFDRLDGSTQYLSWDVKPWFDEQGELGGISITTHDVTELELAKQTTEKQRIRYHAMMHHSNFAMMIFDQRGYLIEFNRKAQKLLGHDYQTMQHFHLTDWVNLSSQEVKEIFSNIDRDCSSTHLFESAYTTQSKEIRFAEISLSNIKLENEDFFYVTAIDITDKKQHEQMIQLNSHQLELATKSANMGIWQLDLASHNLSWDKQMYEIYGLNPLEPISYDDWLKSVHFEDLDDTEIAFRNAFSNIAHLDHVFRILTPLGKIRHIKISSRPSFNSDGKMISLIGTNMDITKLKMTEQENTSLFNRSPVAIAQVSELGQILQINQRFTELTGYQHRSIPNFDTFLKLILPNAHERDRAINKWQNAVHKAKESNGITEAIELKLRCSDNQKRVMLISGAVTPKGLVISLLDIHELKQLQQQQKAIFETRSTGIVHVKNSRIAWANPTFEKLLGYQNKELNGEPTSRVYANYADFEKISNSYKQGTDNKTQTLELELLTKQGRKVPVIVGLTVINSAEHEAIAVVTDISRLRKTLKELEAAKQVAETANIAKSAFVANMSHEIRTPLNGILGLTQLMLECDNNNSLQSDYLKRIQSSSYSLLNIINDILDFSKLEANKLEIIQQPFELSRLVKNIQSLFQIQMEQKGLLFKTSLDHRLPNTLLGDATRITQVLNNLVGNAYKFTEIGQITLNIRQKQLKSKEVLIEFSIEDTGIGIEPKQLERLFSPFEQADVSHSRKYGGTGLGLSISQNLTQLMGGKIRVHSEVNKGSTFSFELNLPISHHTINAAPLHNEKLRLRETQQLLLVEDNETNQVVAKAMLEKIGFEVSLANNGQEAVNGLKERSFDIVFMDIQMPVMNGYDATREIRTFNTDTPIIALSAAAMEKDKTLSIEAGMQDHLAKPIQTAELNQVIKRYFATSKHQATGTDIPDELVQLNSVDIPALFDSLNGNVDLTHRLLCQFADTLQKDIIRLSELSPCDPECAKMIHRIKGTSGNLSIHAIQKLAQQMEQSQQNQQHLWLEFNQLSETVIKEIQSKLGQDVQTTTPEAMSILAHSVLERLQQNKLIHPQDIDQILRYLEQSLRHPYGELETLKQLFETHQFNELQQQLLPLLQPILPQ